MAITEYTINTSVSTTEYSITNGSTVIASQTGDGVVQAFIHIPTMAAGDRYQVRVYEKVVSGGTQYVVYEAVIEGVQDEVFVTPAITVMHGWDITVDKLAGTDRTVIASVRLIPVV